MLSPYHWNQPRKEKEQGCDKRQLVRPARVQEIAIAQDKIVVLFRCRASRHRDPRGWH